MDDASNGKVQNAEFDVWLHSFHRCSPHNVYEIGRLASATMAWYRESRLESEWVCTKCYCRQIPLGLGNGVVTQTMFSEDI